MNGYGKLRRCTDKRKVIVEFWLCLAAAFTVIRRLINRARVKQSAGFRARERGRDPLSRPPQARTARRRDQRAQRRPGLVPVAG
jgi:hypothetical protein